MGTGNGNEDRTERRGESRRPLASAMKASPSAAAASPSYGQCPLAPQRRHHSHWSNELSTLKEGVHTHVMTRQALLPCSERTLDEGTCGLERRPGGGVCVTCDGVGRQTEVMTQGTARRALSRGIPCPERSGWLQTCPAAMLRQRREPPARTAEENRGGR